MKIECFVYTRKDKKKSALESYDHNFKYVVDTEKDTAEKVRERAED